MTDIKRSTYRKYGTAVKRASLGRYVAWATHGRTTGENPLEEPGETWFQLGRSEEEALSKLHAELDSLGAIFV